MEETQQQQCLDQPPQQLRPVIRIWSNVSNQSPSAYMGDNDMPYLALLHMICAHKGSIQQQQQPHVQQHTTGHGITGKTGELKG